MYNLEYKTNFNIQLHFFLRGTHVTPNNSTNNNVVFYLVYDLKIVYYNNYLSTITMP